MNILFGRSGKLALYGNDDYAVVLDTTLDMVVASGDSTSLVLFSEWSPTTEDLSNGEKRLCNLSLQSFETESLVASSGRRMYSIPEGVQNEAKKALEWRKEHKRGGTPVGLNTARTLAKGGQIGIEKLRHIAKYFPRHEVDKKGKGWAPGQDNFPSNGRIAWALWGGDVGRRWASAIVDRENKKAVTAGGSSMDPFKAAYELEEGYAPEFMVRISLEDGGIDRLYKVEANGDVCVWDDETWDNMGNVSGDVWSYDRDLDGNEDSDNYSHIIIDIDSAVFIASRLTVDPYGMVTVDEIDPEETALMQEGIFNEDFSTIDMVMTAAGEPVAPEADKKGLTDADGNFTPEERSDLAKKQPRDAGGLFVKVGSRTVVAGDKERGSGVLESIDYKNGKVNVRLDSGNLISVDPKYTDKEENAKTATPSATPGRKTPAMKTDGILGKAKRSDALNKATLPSGTKAIGPGDVQNLLSEWTKDLSESRKKSAVETAAPGTKSSTDADGNYEVKKGDSLWAIAEKTKADGQSTEDQWLKIMAANKGKLKSGDPNLIFAGEKVAIPGKSGSSKSSSPSAREAMRKDKQDTSRSDDAAKNKAAADQERIRNAKQEESRGAKNVQEAMRKDKQEVSKAEAAKNKAAADQEKLRNARNADRLDTTTKNKAKAEADARAGMQADKKSISDAEAAKKKAAADQEKLRNARNQDRVDTTAKGKAKAAADARAGMQADKKAISDAEAAKNKASADQEKLRDARNADRADTTSKNKAKAEADARAGMQADKKAISTSEAKAAADAKAKAGVQADKRASSAAETARAKQVAEDKAKSGVQADKKASSVTEAKQAADAKAKAGVQADKKVSSTAETAKAKAAADAKVKSGVQADKKTSSVAEAKAAADAKGRSSVQQANKSDSSGITETVDQKAKDAGQSKVTNVKKQDQPGIKNAQVSNVRKKLAEKQEFYRQQREKYGTYKDRVGQSKARQEKNKRDGK